MYLRCVKQLHSRFWSQNQLIYGQIQNDGKYDYYLYYYECTVLLFLTLFLATLQKLVFLEYLNWCYNYINDKINHALDGKSILNADKNGVNTTMNSIINHFDYESADFEIKI